MVFLEASEIHISEYEKIYITAFTKTVIWQYFWSFMEFDFFEVVFTQLFIN